MHVPKIQVPYFEYFPHPTPPSSLPAPLNMNKSSSSKRPKLEGVDDEEQVENNREKQQQQREEDGEDEDQVEALVTLIDYRTKEVDHLHKKTNYYRAQMEEAERSLKELHTKLTRLQSQSVPTTLVTSNDLPRPRENGATVSFSANGTSIKLERKTSPQNHVPLPKPQLLIPAIKPKTIPSATRVHPVSAQVSIQKQAPNLSSSMSQVESASRGKQKNSSVTHGPLDNKAKALRTDSLMGTSKKKKSAGSRETQDLIPSVRTSSARTCFRVQSSNHIGSQHSRRLRCLELNPAYGQLFCTSALDGVVNVWELHRDGSSASLLNASKCSSSKGRWPEDVAWHPDGDFLFAAYTADSGEPQVSVLNFNASQDKRVNFLEGKPHKKGVINNIEFMPWIDLSFVTGGSDHAVILWREKENGKLWKPETVHKNLHSSAVNGVGGLQQKRMIISVGADKRIIGFDLQTGRSDFKHQLESKCMSVLLNPVDLNLFMVQAGSLGKQLRLFDIRLKQTEIHSFGWKQESSESQSALINQSWSSDGFCISSGSADPMIHIFDIRYTGQIPSQSVNAHQKRVFKAAWHRSLPLLVSISSDLHVGLHKII